MADGTITLEANLDESKLKKGLGSLSKTLGKVGSGVGKAFSIGSSAIAGVTAGVGAFLALGEATQDTREDIGKLETTFKTAGFSSETAQKSFQGMVGILGETDQSVEAVNHLAQLTDSEKELAEWTNIAAGVYGTFGDSLPLEGLTEAANETAKVGKVTGPLADALNWAGVSEDKFNQQLALCNNEQERATLITQTLSDVYGEAGDTYSEVNKDLIEARQATADFNNTLADLGELSMPISTMLKNSFSSAVQSILPDMEMIMGSIVAIFSGENVDETQLAEGMTNLTNKVVSGITQNLPKIFEIGTTIIQSILQGIQNNLPQLAFGALSIITNLINFFLTNLPLIINMGMQLIAQLCIGLGQALPQLIPQALNCIITIVNGLLDNIDMLIDAAIELILGLADGLINAIPILIEKAPEIIAKLVSALIKNAPKILEAGVELIVKLVEGVWSVISKLGKMAGDIIETIWNGLKALPGKMLEVGKNLVQGIWNGISNAAQWIWDKISGFCSGIVDKIKGFFGIHSPSTLFADEIGANLALGLGEGFGDSLKDVFKDMQSTVDFETQKLSANLSTTATNNRMFTANITTQPSNVYLDSKKVGRIVTPSVTKTLRGAGAYS